MVDISAKLPTLRTATAEAVVTMKPETLSDIMDGQITKGDVLSIARLAGISAAKKTPELIPLSHPLAIHNAAIDFDIDHPSGTVRIISTVRALERSGMEMEAMVSASVAALTVYDMCKGSDKGIIIGPIKLLHKEGGKSGTYGKPYQARKEESGL